MDKAKVLGEGEIAPLLWRFSVPAVTGVLVNALYNVVDSIFVGQGVGEIALTAVGIVFPLMIVLVALGMLVGVGAAALVSIRLGEKNKDGAELVLGNALNAIIVLVLASSLAALLYLDPLLACLGATPDVLPYAREFARIIIAGSVLLHVSFGLNGVIQAQGDPRTALATMLIAALLNVVLNPLFIFGLDMGIAGSAWATVVSQGVAAAWVLAYFLRGAGTLKLRARCLALRPDIIMAIFKIGLAPCLMQLCASLIAVVFNYSLLEHGGAVAVAAYGVINRVAMLAVMPVVGISQGAQPIIGYNYGAGRSGRVAKTVRLAVAVAAGICLVSLAGLEIFAESIVRLFGDGGELVRVGATGLRIYVACLPLVGMQITCANYFQAVGKAGYAILFNLLRQVIILIPVLCVLPGFLGLTGIWLAVPISDLGAALLTGVVMVREFKRLQASAAEQPACGQTRG